MREYDVNWPSFGTATSKEFDVTVRDGCVALPDSSPYFEKLYPGETALRVLQFPRVEIRKASSNEPVPWSRPPTNEAVGGGEDDAGNKSKGADEIVPPAFSRLSGIVSVLSARCTNGSMVHRHHNAAPVGGVVVAVDQDLDRTLGLTLTNFHLDDRSRAELKSNGCLTISLELV